VKDKLLLLWINNGTYGVSSVALVVSFYTGSTWDATGNHTVREITKNNSVLSVHIATDISAGRYYRPVITTIFTRLVRDVRNAATLLGTAKKCTYKVVRFGTHGAVQVPQKTDKSSTVPANPTVTAPTPTPPSENSTG
jgi:hypothetical protein